MITVVLHSKDKLFKNSVVLVLELETKRSMINGF